MALAAVKKLLDGLSMRAIRNRLDKRKLQQELDIHRLFLLTSHYDRCKSAEDGEVAQAEVDEIMVSANSLSAEARESAVAASLRAQILRQAFAAHSAFTGASHVWMEPSRTRPQGAQGSPEGLARTGRQASADVDTTRKRPRGLAMAVGALTEPECAPGSSEHGRTAPEAEAPSRTLLADMPDASAAAELDWATVQQVLKERLGFTLRAAPSAIPHAQAGTGLWLDGRARIGSVVALYPGIVYTPLDYRSIPGYPRVDSDNPYLLARFDGAVLDAKPWGLGPAAEAEFANVSGSALGSDASLQHLQQLERRHPYALAHFANHPPAGVPPNVMVASFDFTPSPDLPDWVRRYIPTVPHHRSAADDSPGPRAAVPGLALVALRDVADEELLLNYRLSTHVARPDWYTPVDAAEDERRWA